MTDCPHEHEPDTGRQTFRDIIREETDGGRDLVRFFTNAMFDKDFIFKDDPWKYTLSVLDGHVFATDGHGLFIYDSDLGRYVPAADKLRPFLADSMKHEWSPARVDLILNWYRERSPRLWDPPPLDRVNVLNGILDLESGDLEPHSPDFLSPIQINPVFAGYAAQQLQETTGGIDRVFDNLLEIARGNDPSANGYDRLRATRVLYDRGFGKVTRNTPRTPPQGSERPPKSEESNNHTNHSSDNNRPVPRLEQKLDDALGPPQSPDKQQCGATPPHQTRRARIHTRRTRLLASAGRVPQSADNSLGYLRRWLAVPFDTSFNESDLDRTVLYGAYKDWCVFNRTNPVSPRRLYKSVWEIFRVDTHNTNGRRLFRGVQLIPEAVPTGADSAESAEAVQK